MTHQDTFADIQQSLTQATQRATDLANAFNGKSTDAKLISPPLTTKEKPKSEVLKITPYDISSNDPSFPLASHAESLLHTLVSHIAEAMFLVSSAGVIEMINPPRGKVIWRAKG
jgi:hypothetical protein